MKNRTNILSSQAQRVIDKLASESQRLKKELNGLREDHLNIVEPPTFQRPVYQQVYTKTKGAPGEPEKTLDDFSPMSNVGSPIHQSKFGAHADALVLEQIVKGSAAINGEVTRPSQLEQEDSLMQPMMSADEDTLMKP